MPPLTRFLILFIVCAQCVFISASAQIKGLRAEYFNDVEFTNRALTRIESQPYLNFYLESPAPGVNTENFSVRWTGKITPLLSGEHTFVLRTDDGVRLWIGDKKLIDSWHDQEANDHSASIDLDQGKPYDIKIEYYNGPLHAIFSLEWEQPDDSGYEFMGFTFFKTQTEIPASAFSTPDTVQTRIVKKSEQPLEVKKEPSLTRSVKKTTKPAEKKRVAVDTVIAINESIELKSVEFEQTRSELPDAAHKELNALAEYLKKHPALKIRIIGHTDYAGDSTANVVLSEQRASAVGNYLKLHGINAQRITIVAMGSSQPKMVQGEVHERTKNRRVEFILAEE